MLCPIYSVPCTDWTLSVSCFWYCLLSESAKRKKTYVNGHIEVMACDYSYLDLHERFLDEEQVGPIFCSASKNAMKII